MAFVDGFFDGAPATLDALVAGGDDLLERVRSAADAASWHPLADAEFASALLTPPVILAIGLNYSAHSGELGLKTDSTPTVFNLWPNSLTGHDGTTSWPRSLSESVDYEAELGVIVGRPAKNVDAADALGHVWGYTVVNDITARNIQFSEAQWSRCKSFDGFTPTGPFAVTADEISDPQNLHIWTVVDGHTVQDASTGQMVRSVATLIAHLSQSATLLPGTLISTGSPGGAGYSRDPQIFLRDRSTVTVAVEGIGELTTHCRIVD
jgi:2-keto-4-pentenoate hydratase/2-oxohepta-3-ene-1,7-dioic acid hydratase in catechol pathway